VNYDANGNTLSDPSGKSYTWDFENRLVLTCPLFPRTDHWLSHMGTWGLEPETSNLPTADGLMV
jgi:hypothetical protein